MKIKPCPFCASEGEIHKWHDKLYSVECTNCICSGANSVSKDGAIRWWNRRIYVEPQKSSK